MPNLNNFDVNTKLASEVATTVEAVASAEGSEVITAMVGLIKEELVKVLPANVIMVDAEYFLYEDLPEEVLQKTKDIQDEQDRLRDLIWADDPEPTEDVKQAAHLQYNKLHDEYVKLITPFMRVGKRLALPLENSGDAANDEEPEADMPSPQYLETSDIQTLLHRAGAKCTVLDAYGSSYCKWEINGKIHEFIVWEDYGDSDSERHYDKPLVHTLCLTHFNDGIVSGFEACDVNMLDTKTLILENWRKGNIDGTQELTESFLHELGDKRAFYYHPKEGDVTIRCTEWFYDAYEQYQDPSRPVGNPNLSGTRALFELPHTVESKIVSLE